MIRKNPIKSNLIREINYSCEALIKECLDSIRPESERCPLCRCQGNCHIHEYYGRTLIEFIDGRPQKVDICIPRVICENCKSPSTHAILPDPIIPYCRHSLCFILRVLAEDALHLKSIEKICERFEISRNTYYRWKKLYEEHRREWQGILKSIETSLLDSIIELFQEQNPFSAFSAGFFKLTGLSFLQSHKNPVHCQRRNLAPENDFV